MPETYHMVNQQFVDEEHAQMYRVYRPDCPQEVADLIISYLKEKFGGPLETAVDVGCGSGQSTTILAPFFKHVHGLDVSEMQIKEAKRNLVLTNITYRISPAEILPFETGSVQLVTAGACLHWFQTDIFFPEVRRVLSNNGVFAAYTNHSLRPLVADPVQAAEVDRLFYKSTHYREKRDRLMKKTFLIKEFGTRKGFGISGLKKYEELNAYWSPEVQISLKKYDSIFFPFEEFARVPDIRQVYDGYFSDIIGYMKTLSAFQNMKKNDSERAKHFIESFSSKLHDILKSCNISETQTIKLYRDFFMVLCRKAEK